MDEKNNSTVGNTGLPPQASFNLFVSGLMMEGLIAMGELEHPISKTKNFSEMHAKFIIDTISMLQEKTKNNLSKDESDMLESVLYELRMRFLNKTGKK